MPWMVAGGLAAAGATSSFAGAKGQKGGGMKPAYHPLQKPFVGASQALIPQYLMMLGGRMPWWMQLQQNQLASQAQQQYGANTQQYLRTMGQAGQGGSGRMGSNLKGMSDSMMASLIQAANQSRLAGQMQAMQGMQEWSRISPGQKSEPERTDPGMAALQGGMGGLGAGLGMPAKPKTPSPTVGGIPPYRQGQAPIPLQNQGQQGARNFLQQQTGAVTGMNKWMPNFPMNFGG